MTVSLQEAGTLSSVNAVVWTLTSLLAGVVADKLANDRYFQLLTVRRLMNTVGFIGPAVFLTIISFVPLTNAPGAVVVLMVITIGLAGFVRAGYTVNHLDIAPRYASVIFSTSTTIAIIPGIVAVQLTGYMLDASSDNWALPFMITVGIYLVGTGVYLKWSRAQPLTRAMRMILILVVTPHATVFDNEESESEESSDSAEVGDYNMS